MKNRDLTALWRSARNLAQKRRLRRETGRFPLEYLLLFTTMRCNARCAHCFLRDKLNVPSGEMTLAQIDRIAETAPDFNQLNLTGGEATLRADLMDIVAAFADRRRIRTVMINTNGSLTERCLDLASRALARWPELHLVFQVSIDGPPELHDRLRGVPGLYEKAAATLRELAALSRENPRLHLHALTVVMDANYSNLLETNDCLRRDAAPDLRHAFELVRDVDSCAWNIPDAVREEGTGPGGPGLPPFEAFDRICRDLRTLNRRGPVPAYLWLVHNMAQLKMVETGRPEFRCVTVGESLAVLYSDGRVAHCEFSRPFADLADFDYDFAALWNSEAAERARGMLKGCWCTHGCWHGTSVELSWKGIRRAFLEGLR